MRKWGWRGRTEEVEAHCSSLLGLAANELHHTVKAISPPHITLPFRNQIKPASATHCREATCIASHTSMRARMKPRTAHRRREPSLWKRITRVRGLHPVQLQHAKTPYRAEFQTCLGTTTETLVS